MTEKKKENPQVPLITIPEEWANWIKQNALLLAILFMIFLLIIIVIWRTRPRRGGRRYLYYG